METILFLAFLTYFSALVASRASRLNRNPWPWAIFAWTFSPLVAWLILEISGKKNEKQADETDTMNTESGFLSLQENQLIQGKFS
jgi:hypothetical protein